MLIGCIQVAFGFKMAGNQLCLINLDLRLKKESFKFYVGNLQCAQSCDTVENKVSQLSVTTMCHNLVVQLSVKI